MCNVFAVLFDAPTRRDDDVVVSALAMRFTQTITPATSERTIELAASRGTSSSGNYFSQFTMHITDNVWSVSVNVYCHALLSSRENHDGRP